MGMCGPDGAEVPELREPPASLRVCCFGGCQSACSSLAGGQLVEVSGPYNIIVFMAVIHKACSSE